MNLVAIGILSFILDKNYLKTIRACIDYLLVLGFENYHSQIGVTPNAQMGDDGHLATTQPQCWVFCINIFEMSTIQGGVRERIIRPQSAPPP